MLTECEYGIHFWKGGTGDEQTKPKQATAETTAT